MKLFYRLHQNVAGKYIIRKVKKMYHLFLGSGRKIQAIAKIVFVLGVILSVILGILFGFETYHNFYGDTEIYFERPWLTAIIIIFGPIVSFINSLFIYGFGEIVEFASNSQLLDDKMYTLNEKVENIEKATLKLSSNLYGKDEK